MIDGKSLEELRALTLEDGLHLTDQELLAMGTSLLNLVEAVYKPIKKEWFDEINKNNSPLN